MSSKKSNANRFENYYLQIVRFMWDRHPWLTIGIAGVGLLDGFMGVAVIDTLTKAVHDPLDRSKLAALFILLLFGNAIVKVLVSLLPSYAAMKVYIAIRAALARSILNTPLRELERLGVPNTLSLLNSDIPQLMATFMLIPGVLTKSMIVLFGSMYLGYLSWELLLLSVIMVPPSMLAVRYVVQRGMDFVRLYREEADTLNEHTLGLLQGIKELQLNRHRRRWFKKAGLEFSSKRMAYYGFMQAVWFSSASNIDTVAMLITIGAFVFGVTTFFPLQPEVLTAAILTLIYVLDALRGLIDMVPEFGQSAVAINRLEQFGFIVSNQEVSKMLAPEARFANEADRIRKVELCEVQIRYEGKEGASEPQSVHQKSDAEDFVFGPLSLTLRPGEVVFVVGSNGSGKSTLAKLLSGLYAPIKGKVLVNDKSLEHYGVAEYRNQVSAVFSDFHLFKRVLSQRDGADNLNPNQLLDRLGLREKVLVKEGLYSTTTALSTGQRKRLSLLNVCLEDKPVVILDECTSDQDPEFRKYFYEELIPEFKAAGKFIVIISHEDYYFNTADRVIRLEEGRIQSDEVVQPVGPLWASRS